MIDPEAAKNAALVGAGAYLAKDLLKQAFGPTADYIGEGLKKFTAKRIENIDRILRKFINKLGQRINEPGQVHPKLLRSVIADGSFCDDELTAEYYGGVLASSRTGVVRDDRGITYLEQLSHLSTYQIRTHFIVYTVLRNIFLDSHRRASLESDRNAMRTFIPFSSYKRAMAFAENNEDKGWTAYAVHAISGLESINLIGDLTFGGGSFLNETYGGIIFTEAGFVYAPSLPGLSFYLWGTGYGNYKFDSLVSNEITIEVPKGIEIPKNAFSLREEKERQKKESQQSNP